MEEKFSVYYEEGVPIIIPKSIIIFAGHPDDELISCGGTLLKYKELGTNITVIIASIGRGGFAKEKDKDRIEKIRSRECENLQKKLNIQVIELGYEHIEVSRDLVSKITNIIRELKPQIVFSPYYLDFHRIHRNLSLIVREAIYHSSTSLVYGGKGKLWVPLGVYYYESPSCKFDYISNNSRVIVNISKFLDKKIQFFEEIYPSQKKILKNSIRWMKTIAQTRGFEIQKSYGEAFIPETTFSPLKILIG